ncbi:tRNA N(3)-methylcytidine methyltransferase METTL6 [Phlebotomus papatasi]|uniref:tRNA N(3)-methylcytidine methyltransferase METTL6 n=1 Tax=Phlebotomus papatasi TaxID=29031 RepID=UPI002483F7DC|nr:tRNA N(3)-methylcytidine methyltransferase METTL6 [Phlebotomus papatasi]
MSQEVPPEHRENRRKVSSHGFRPSTTYQSQKLERECRKNWDLFYKRNKTNFFKDRNWTTREFTDLLHLDSNKILLEVGCGVGNFIFPLLEVCQAKYIYACDFSQEAIKLLKENTQYTEDKMKAFTCDITTDDIFSTIAENSVDIVTLIFVLSAIHPDKFRRVVENLHRILKQDGVVLFRDYGLNDMAQWRFKDTNMISENFYVRQDGTRSYFFSDSEILELFEGVGFRAQQNSYVHRQTINVKENVDVKRTFVQGIYQKT